MKKNARKNDVMKHTKSRKSARHLTTLEGLLMIALVAVSLIWFITDSALNTQITAMNATIQSQEKTNLDLRLRMRTQQDEIENLHNENVGLNAQSRMLYAELQNELDYQPSYINIAKSIANANIWEDGKYVCTDFSRDLVLALERAGYSAHIQDGYYNPDGQQCTGISKDKYNCRHEWVMLEIPIEATNGQIISPSDYSSSYTPIAGRWGG